MDANWWNNALESYDVGRQHRADRENADAFSEGGYDAVEQAAGNRGDLQTATATRRFQDQRQQQAFEWFQSNAPFARNALRRARVLPPEQRGSFLSAPHVRQRFEQMGFQPDQIDAAVQGLSGPEAEQWFANLDAAFRQHEDPNWQLVGNQAVAVDQQSGDIQLGGRVPDSVGAGGRYATAEEVAQAGYRPGSVVWVAPGAPPRVIQAPNAGRAPNAPGQYPDDGYDYHD